MRFTDLPAATGVSLKPEYFAEALALKPGEIWFEVHPENYMIGGGPRLEGLLSAAERFPISLHGVGASLGGPELPTAQHLKALRRLVDLVNPAAVSEHAVWSRTRWQYFADLLPLPRTRESLQKLVDGIDHFQNGIGRRILIENPSNYLPIKSEMDEPDFLVEVAKRTGCGLLFDVNNLYISANNCGMNTERYIESLPSDLVGEIHIAGHTPDERFGDALLIDSHAAMVSEPVWALLAFALRHLGPKPALIERDANLPPFAELMQEKQRCDRLQSAISLKDAANA
ncbi:MAG: DUF692 domain-containing protein [Sedimenticolaceae bacterium]